MGTKIYLPFLPILTLIFITLKLTGHIGWSWFWVLSPMLIPFLIGVILALGAWALIRYLQG